MIRALVDLHRKTRRVVGMDIRVGIRSTLRIRVVCVPLRYGRRAMSEKNAVAAAPWPEPREGEVSSNRIRRLKVDRTPGLRRIGPNIRHSSPVEGDKWWSIDDSKANNDTDQGGYKSTAKESLVV